MSVSVFPFSLMRPYRERRVFATSKQEMQNGRTLVRAEFGTYGRMTIQARARVPYGGQTLATWIAWWLARQGSYDPFLVKCHHAAHKTQTLEAVGTGDGSTTAFALDMRYIDESTLLVYKAGVLQTLTTHYTVSGNNTAPIVTFVAAPAGAAAITATYDYYHPMRHESDDVEPQDLHLTGADATAVVGFDLTLVETEPGAHRA